MRKSEVYLYAAAVLNGFTDVEIIFVRMQVLSVEMRKAHIWCNWPFAKTRPPDLLFVSPTNNAPLTLHIMFSRKTEQVTSGMGTLSFQIWYFFKEIQTINTVFVAL